MNMQEMFQKMKKEREEFHYKGSLKVEILVTTEGKRILPEYENKILTLRRKNQIIEECHKILKEQNKDETYGATGFMDFHQVVHMFATDIPVDFTVKWSVIRELHLVVLEKGNKVSKYL